MTPSLGADALGAGGGGLEGGIPLVLLRMLFVVLLLLAFGASLFAATVAPRALARADAATSARIRARLLGLARVGVWGALLALPLWLRAQGADMADAHGAAAVLGAAPTVLLGTAFGELLLGQAAVLAAAALALTGRAGVVGRLRLAAGLLALATALQAGHGHAWAMYGRPSPLLLAGVVHLLAAGGWLGGLPPLLLTVREAPPRVGAAAARWFSPLGKWCVAGIVASAAWQFWVLVGGLPGLVGTAYGWVAGVKIGLLGVLLGFALLNRHALAPALLGGTPERARRRLLGAVSVQSGVGVLTVLAAGVLGSLPPSMHLQPIWPFAWRPSLDTVSEDPDFLREVIGAGLALAAAVLAVLATILLRRRLRWFAVVPVLGAAAVAALAVPHLDLLLVEAYPTSYFTSPTGFAATDIAAGAALFPQHCAVCHGAEGRGNGPAAAGLPVPPADLTAGHLWMHADGELFWWLTHGIEAPEGGPAMPGFAGVLTPDQRWALIDYVRAHNAGLVARATGAWTPPLQAPALEAACADGGTVSLSDLRGGFVRLAFGAEAPPPAPGVTTILVGAGLTPPHGAGPCVATDPAVATAYAVVTGIAPAALPGTQVLIDGAGWLRAVQHPGQAPGWDDPGRLLADMRRLREHPIAADAGMDHAHMQM